MIIKCGKCGRTIDLNTQATVLSFIQEIPVKCKCGNEIYYKGNEVKKEYGRRRNKNIKFK